MSHKLNENQLKFVELRTAGATNTDAYKQAYGVSDDNIAASCASRLLRNAKVLETINNIEVARLEKITLTSDWVLERLRLVYNKADEEGDHNAALKALDMMAKHVGIYAEDNRQKGGAVNVDALKAKLRGRGIDVDKIGAGKN